MQPARALFIPALTAACVFMPAEVRALTYQATGVNLTADEGLGARQQGMGLMRSGFQDGADAVINAPASMNDVNDFTFSTEHVEQFDAATFDNASVLIPWHADGTMGLAIGRYAVSGIQNRPEGLDAQPINPGVFTTSDWLMAGSLSRRFGALDVGGTMNLLYRKLDQSGLGLRADAMAQYTFQRQYRTGIFIRGLIPSSARWASGYTEYETPEAIVYASGRWKVPYFYGELQAGFETPGLIQRGARSENELEGSRAVSDPMSLLKTSKMGAEFRFDFGLRVRAGFSELNPSQAAHSIRLGAGYDWRHILGVDYAYSSHDALSQTHRIALWWTPSFARFEGRGFRPAPANRAVTPTPGGQSPQESAPPSDTEEKANPGSDTPKTNTDKGKEKEVLEED